jgi:hypothetical protein
MRIAAIAIFLALAFVGPAWADITDVQAGDWNAGTTWSTNPVIPANGDSVSITGTQVSLTGTTFFPTLTKLTLGGVGNLYINNNTIANTTTTISGPVVFDGGGTLEMANINNGTSNLSLTGTVGLTSGTIATLSTFHYAKINLNAAISGDATTNTRLSGRQPDVQHPL